MTTQIPPSYRPTSGGVLGLLLRFLVAGCLLVLSSAHAAGSEAQNEDVEFFERKIRPVLVEHCYRCHSADADKVRGGLLLDTRQAIRKGGESGAAVVPEQPEESLLLDALRHDSFEMPPDRKLPDSVVADFESWIERGAVDPRDGEVHVPEAGIDLAAGRQFWSFQPLAKQPAPSIDDGSWPANDIDRYILAGLEAEGLAPGPIADRTTLVRRVYFALIGLPPTPEQIAEFVLDPADDEVAYAHLVDRLLESSHFGERWGRHWLDVVRFAQSSGGGRTLLFPEAWRYRDYVIDALNRDLPYDQFLREQLAGDLMHASDWRERQRQLVATAFLVLGPTNYELQDKEQLEMDIVDEQLDTMGKALLGMTLGCARCHDHKFDPIPMRDYYAMAGIFMSTKSVIHSNVSAWNLTDLPVDPEQDAIYREHEAAVKKLKDELNEAKRELKSLGGKDTSKSLDVDSLPGIVIDDIQATKKGVWTKSQSAKGFVGEGYLHDGNEDAAKSVTYATTLSHEGAYEVQVTFTPGDNRSPDVPIVVHHAEGSTTIRVNQKQPGSESHSIHSLGVFRFLPESEARVIVTNEGAAPGHVIADAVLFIPRNSPTKPAPLPRPDQVDKPENITLIVPDPGTLPGIVVDDTQATLVGKWKHSVHTPPFVGASYVHDMKEQKGTKSATFVPTLPLSGMYEVRIAHNSNVRRANNVPITVLHADGETTLHIDEGTPAPINGLFRSLGKFRFEEGRAGSVTISTEGTDGKYVIVDAVQFLPEGASTAEALVRQRKQQRKAEREQVAKRVKQLETQLKSLNDSGPKRPQAMAVVDHPQAADIPLAIRGVVHNKGPIVPRGFLQVVSRTTEPQLPDHQSGRMQLADWIVHSDNPLPARVMANRVWYWLMGEGLVSTVDNFGAMGAEPTHPELLDYLASEFVENGWSIKTLIRKIMLSRVYRLSSETDPVAVQADPDNRLYWRMRRQRLDAESLRDAMLHISGQLDASMGGPNLKKGTKIEYDYGFDSTRRSVYVPVFRNTLPELFEAFDFSDPNIQNGKRSTSTIATQALLMMNHPKVLERSRAAAEQLLANEAIAPQDRVSWCYRQTLGYEPDDGQLEIANRFVGDSSDPQRWALLFQALFQSLDFRYVN